MTADRKDGSRKGMRAIPLTQRQRRQIKPSEAPDRQVEATSPATSSHKHRAPRVRRPRAAATKPTPSENAMTKAGKVTTREAVETPRPRATRTAPRPAATTRAAMAPAPAPQRAPRRAASSAAPLTAAGTTPAPRRTQRRPPVSSLPVSPIDLIDTAPLVAPASLRPQVASPAEIAETAMAREAAELPETTVLPKLADTVALKAPKSGPRARTASRSAAPEDLSTVDTAPLFAPLDDVETTRLTPAASALDTVDTTRLKPPVDTIDTTRLAAPVDTIDTTQLAAPVDTIDTTHLAAPVDTIDTTRLAAPSAQPAPFADVAGLAETTRLKLPSAAQKPALAMPPAELIDTTPLGLRFGSAPVAAPKDAIDAIDTTSLAGPLDTIDTAQLSAPIDTLDTTQLGAPGKPAGATLDALDAIDTAPLGLTAAPAVDTFDTTQLSAPVYIGPVDGLDTTQLSAPDPLGSRDALDSGSSPSAPSDPGSPRRVKVRVRRRRADTPAEGMEIVTPLPLAEARTAPDQRDAAASLTLNVIASEETARLATAGAPAASVADLPSTVKLTHTPPATPAPAVIEQSADAVVAPVTASGKTILDATNITDMTATAEAGAIDAEPLGSAPEAEASGAENVTGDEDTFPPQPVVTTRKLPTLAVMAALANRAEARESAGDSERAEPAPAADMDTDPLREPPLFAPAASLDRIDPIAPLSQPEAFVDERALAQPPAQPHDAALVSDLRALLESAPEAPAASRGHGSRSLGRGTRVPSQPLTATGATEADPAAEGRRRMWWLNAAPLGRGARQTPPVSPSAPSAPSAPAVSATPRPTSRAADSVTRWSAPGARQLERGRVSERGRTAPDDGPGALLVWAGGVQAALSGLAALVAAIALLNGGPRSLGVFGWAIAFALIAGVGAGLGHLAWRARQARRATLAITLSHLALLIWALALLGPLPALMALVPITVALTLRGLGRAAGVVTAVAEGAFYLVALLLSMAQSWPFPQLIFTGLAAEALNGLLTLAGIGLGAVALISLTAAGAHERARTLAIERAAYLSASELDALRAETEDDADALRRALSASLRGVPTQPVLARGALSPLAEQVNITGERLAELARDREQRKRMEAATRRLISNMKRAWMGLSWEWPEASGVILDDLIALLRTPPSTHATRLPEDSTPTGQLVAPHLYRAGQPGISIPSQPLNIQPGLWPDRSAPSQPSGVWPALWPSDPEPLAPGADPFALPPSPRWEGSNSQYPIPGPISDPQDGSARGSNGANGHYDTNGANGANGRSDARGWGSS